MATLAAIKLAGTLAWTVIPVAELDGVTVSVLPSELRPRPFTVSAIVRLLIVILTPKTVAVGADVTAEPEMVTSAPEPGTKA